MQAYSDFRFLPTAVGFYQRDEALICLCKRNVSLNTLLADVEIDHACLGADVAEIGICHLSRAIDDTTHDCDFHAGKMGGARADPLGDCLQIKESAATSRTRDKFCAGGAHTNCLKDIQAQFADGSDVVGSS